MQDGHCIQQWFWVWLRVGRVIASQDQVHKGEQTRCFQRPHSIGVASARDYSYREATTTECFKDFAGFICNSGFGYSLQLARIPDLSYSAGDLLIWKMTSSCLGLLLYF